MAGERGTAQRRGSEAPIRRLAEERQQWQAVNSTLQGICQALSILGPVNPGASAAPLPQEA